MANRSSKSLYGFVKSAGSAMRSPFNWTESATNVRNPVKVGQDGQLSSQNFKTSGWINSCWVQFGQLGKVPKSKSTAFLPRNLQTKYTCSSWNTSFVRTLRRRAEEHHRHHSKSQKVQNAKVDHNQVSSFPPVPSRFSGMDRLNLIGKPLVFTACVGLGSVIGCTIWQYEEYRKQVADGRFSLTQFSSASAEGGDSSEVNGTRRSQIQLQVESWWSSLSPGEKVFWPICAINTLVCIAWRLPGLSSTMVNYFSCSPMGRAVCWPMLFSVFSHYSFFHLCANMFVLHSFLPAAAQIMGKEQFVALYLTSGTIASLGSHMHKILIGSNVPSLGASGAIMGILGLVCTRMPDIQLGIIFLPGIQFTADTALKCILAIDIAGLLSGWRFMDHAAHLAGCLFGIAFSSWGKDTFWAFRDFIMTRWHKLRTSGMTST